jgi:PAS domain S-box-containing protein
LTFDDALEPLPDPAFLLDPVEDRFVTANASGCALLGYSLLELRKTPISRIHPGELPQLGDFVERVLRECHGRTSALTCRTRWGGYLPTEIALHTLEHEHRVYLLALIHDRSEHRGGEGALRSGSDRSARLGT